MYQSYENEYGGSSKKKKKHKKYLKTVLPTDPDVQFLGIDPKKCKTR
jgi:hypothetical protein